MLIVNTLPHTPEEFYEAYAIAMLYWQRVEISLFHAYFQMFENGNYRQAGAAYYSLDSFGAKLRLVDATARAVLKDEPLKSWKTLSNEIRAASGDRNALAHLPASVVINPDDSLSLVLSRHFHAPPSMARPRKKVYDTTVCRELAKHFTNLASKLEDFRNQHFWASVPPPFAKSTHSDAS